MCEDPFFDRLALPAYRTTPDGEILSANRALASLLGADSVSDVLTLDVGDLYVQPGLRDSLIDRALPGVQIPSEEVELRRVDGSTVWVRISTTAVLDDTGAVLFYEGTLEDIGEERDARMSLADKNRLLDTLTRIQDRFISGSDFGHAVDRLLDDLLELCGSSFGLIARVMDGEHGPYLRTMAVSNIAWDDTTHEMWDRLGPRGLEFHDLDNLLGAAVTSRVPVITNDPARDPRRGKKPDGHPPIDSLLSLPVLKGGKVIGIVALANREGGYELAHGRRLEPFVATIGSLIQAVTEEERRVAAEERELMREQRFQAVVDAALDAIVVFDEMGRIEDFNPAAERMFGHPESAILGSDVRTLMVDDSLGSPAETALRAGKPGLTMEVPLRHASGAAFVADVSLASVWVGERPVVAAVLRDATERAVTEQALRQAKEYADRASRSKDEFLASMSHEFRTPLNGIIGLASILQRGTHGAINEKQREYVTHIEASGRHLLDLIGDVLDLAKIEADRLEPDYTPMTIATVVGEAVSMVREAAVGGGLTLEVDVDADIPDIAADVRRTRQVLLNLLSNAVKFTSAGGRIVVSARIEDDTLEVGVSDTGIGIASDDLETVFLPFHQLDSSLARRHEGTGLGLALSRRLIEMQEGKMFATSQLGAGSRFAFQLPLSRIETPDDSGDDSSVHLPSRIRGSGVVAVLVVEDNDVNRMLVADYLEAHGYKVLTATDGDEAIERATTDRPDVIIMDIQMPGRDGLSATREIKARPETADTPIIALTALAMAGDAERCLAAGCDAYLSKPCDPAEVVSAVRAQLGKDGAPGRPISKATQETGQGSITTWT